MLFNWFKIIQPIFLVTIGCLMIACREKAAKYPPNQLDEVKDSAIVLMNTIAKKVSQNGPAEWLHQFENSPNFFMANEGQLAFVNYNSALSFINQILLKNITKIQLQWSNIRIEALTPNFASLAANYQENITDFTGKSTAFNGYFTSIAKQTTQGWKLHNAHWSSLPAVK